MISKYSFETIKETDQLVGVYVLKNKPHTLKFRIAPANSLDVEFKNNPEGKEKYLDEVFSKHLELK